MKIGIDIDDTIAETTLYLMKYAIDFDRHVLGKDSLVNTSKNLPSCFDWNDFESLEFHKQVLDKYLLDIPPKKDASKYINMLKEKGYEIVFITARDERHLTNPYSKTKAWLEKNNIPYDKIIVSAKYKGPICEKENISIFIDDSIGQCTYISEHYDIKVIMYGGYHNHGDYEQIKRIDNWQDIYSFITNENE